MKFVADRSSFDSPIRWLVWAIFVFGWSLALVTRNPADWADELFPDAMVRHHSAKSLHIAAYAALAILSGWLRVSPRLRWGLLIFMSLHACATELIQTKVPNRSGSIEDVGFDHIGLYLGLVVSWRWWRSSA